MEKYLTLKKYEKEITKHKLNLFIKFSTTPLLILLFVVNWLLFDLYLLEKYHRAVSLIITKFTFMGLIFVISYIFGWFFHLDRLALFIESKGSKSNSFRFSLLLGLKMFFFINLIKFNKISKCEKRQIKSELINFYNENNDK